MRFERLHIPAFGPFTNLKLEFPENDCDFHVIYGENEAGKSSLLRSFRDLLFGIPARSSDDFIHAYRDLKIIAEIVNQADERLVFQRRKGNKGTLRDAEGNVISDDSLAPFLGSVDASYFSTMFGLGTEELREGAQQLLRGEGNLGQALFSASSGGPSVRDVLRNLEEKAERLFRGRAASNVLIRPLAGRYRELMKCSAETLVSPKMWEELEKHLADATERSDTLSQELSNLNLQLQWVDRCVDAFPIVDQLAEEKEKLGALPELPAVADDFAVRARKARDESQEAKREVDRLEKQKSRLEQELAGYEIDAEIISEADEIGRLYQGLAAHQHRMEIHNQEQLERVAIEERLQTGMREADISGDFTDIETFRLSTASRSACREAAEALNQTETEREKHAAALQRVETQVKDLQTKIDRLPDVDVTNLQRAQSFAAAAVEANRTLSETEGQVQRLTDNVQAAHQRLSGVPADFDQTAELPIPQKSTIRQMGSDWDDVEREIKREQSTISDRESQISTLQNELERLQRRGELPSLPDLDQARKLRDYGWSLVLADWKGDGTDETLMEGVPLEEAFPQTIEEADKIADRLRKQADAVAQAEEKHDQIRQLERQQSEGNKRLEALKAQRDQVQSDWQANWQPAEIQPRLPGEMEEWFDNWENFRRLLRDLRAEERVLSQKQQQISQAREKLAHILPDLKEATLTVLYDEAARRIEQGQKTSGERATLTEQLETSERERLSLEQQLADSHAAVEEAESNWSGQCRSVNLPKSISAQTGLDLLQKRNELLTDFDRWTTLTAQLKLKQKAIDQYEQAVSEKAQLFHLAESATATQVNQLWKMFDDAKTQQTRYDQTNERIQSTGRELQEKTDALTQAEEALQALFLLAELKTVEELELLLVHLEQRDRAQEQIATFRATLRGLSRGETMDAFLEKVQAEVREELPEKKERLTREKEGKEGALEAIRKEVHALNKQQDALEEARDDAANYRQQAELCAAELEKHASRFIRLRLAIQFLEAQIERFRKENQGPLVKRSGDYFRNITRGAFNGLDIDYIGDKTPTLAGSRPNEKTVPISGMSDGTRDQLYLSLRLAALEHYLQEHEPMPLILDDLLMTFDNERVKAILPEFAQLSQHTQIFLFTHHYHLVELAHDVLGENKFHLHRLDVQMSE